MTHAICSEFTGFLKKWFLFLLPTQAGQDSHSSTPATSSQLLLCAAQGDMAALAQGDKESLSPMEEKHKTHEPPCSPWQILGHQLPFPNTRKVYRTQA